MEPLIAALKDEDERVQSEAASALRTIAGKDLGRDADEWKTWWNENRETFLKEGNGI